MSCDGLLRLLHDKWKIRLLVEPIVLNRSRLLNCRRKDKTMRRSWFYAIICLATMVSTVACAHPSIDDRTSMTALDQLGHYVGIFVGWVFLFALVLLVLCVPISIAILLVRLLIFVICLVVSPRKTLARLKEQTDQWEKEQRQKEEMRKWRRETIQRCGECELCEKCDSCQSSCEHSCQSCITCDGCNNCNGCQGCDSCEGCNTGCQNCEGYVSGDPDASW